ncbi:MAG: hypothetical protein Q9M32_02120 [Sulfurimonas sp.]|nr:hypothetical protein [Sulfurimonas sp.]MDQ7060392.1 hypothetical protein [Sulfurimonas sp.]
MGLSNREIQQRQTCKLYAYVLASQNKEVPYHLEECAAYHPTDEYDSLFDCTKELSDEIKAFDDATFDKIVNNKDSEDAKELTKWWKMYQIYIPVSDVT